MYNTYFVPILFNTIIITIFMAPLFVSTLYFAYNDEDNECQLGKRAGLTLSDWLKVIGFTDCAIVGLCWIGTFAAGISDNAYAAIMFAVSLYMGAFAKFIIWVIGVVIVSTVENNRCVSRGTDIGIVAVVNLALIWLNSLTSALRRSSSDGDSSYV